MSVDAINAMLMATACDVPLEDVQESQVVVMIIAVAAAAAVLVVLVGGSVAGTAV